MNGFSKRTNPLSDIKDEDIEAILFQEYGLNSNHIEKLKGGTESVAWLVKTERGNFVVKVFGAESDTLERVISETILYEYLYDNAKQYKIEVPKVIHNNHNRSVSQIANQPCILMKHEKLQRLHPATITQEETLRVSVAIAHLHQLLQGYKEKNTKKPVYSRWNLDYNQSAYTILEQSPNGKKYSVNEMKKFQKNTEDVVSFLNNTPYPKQLKESYLHGDIGLEHVQILPNGHLYFFDWADRVRGPVARELSILLFHSYREQDISFERWKELRDWILQSYSQASVLKSNDVNAIVPFIFRRCLDEVRYLAELAIREGKPVEVQAIARRFNLAEKLIESSV